MPQEFELPSPQFIIQTLDPENTELIEKALQIYDKSLGRDYIERHALFAYALNRSRCVALAGFIEQVARGFVIGHIMSGPEKFQYLEDMLLHQIHIPLNDYTIGLIKSISVEQGFRHRGLGTELTQETMNRFVSMGCNALFAVSWISNKPDSSQHMFESLNFRRVLQIDDYWTADSIEREYQCPNCEKECHCSAVFYFREI
ncbi:MAG: GNAT family N-acetyltransferase [Candidatus Roizmanbacteria bacterium]|nr:GNAT family N-acetyltransferase [Candidatus Roizmanbacteria bacterium]